MRVPIGQKLTIGFGLALLIMIAVEGASYQSLNYLAEEARWVQYTHQVLVHLNALMAQLEKVQNTQRGYHISGQEEFLNQHSSAVEAARAQAKELRELTRDNPHQQGHLDRFEPLTKQLFDVAGQIIEARRSQGFAAAQQLFFTSRGPQLMGQIQGILLQMKEEEERLLAQRQQVQERQVRHTQYFTLLGSLLAVGLISMATWAMLRYLRKRQQAEVERDRFFTLSLDLLCITGFDGHFKRLNPAWEQTLGYASEELLGRPFIDFVHPEDRQATVEAAQQLAGGEIIVSFENRYQCKDGAYKWMSWVAVPDLGQGLIYATARDITEGKQVEERLKLDGALKQVRIEILRLQDKVWRMEKAEDIKGVLSFIGAALKAKGISFLAYSINIVEDPEGELSIQVYLHDFEGQQFEGALKTDQPEGLVLLESWNTREIRCRPDLARENIYGEHLNPLPGFERVRSVIDVPFSRGTLALASAQPEAFSAADISLFKEIAQVIEGGFQRQEDLQLSEKRQRALEKELAERRQLEASLQQAAETAAQANQTKSQFLANMSHELRTPMNAIIGFSELLQGQMVGPLNEKQVRYVDNILQGGRHLLNLINDILDLAKVEAGRMQLDPETMDLGSTLQDMKGIVSGLTTKKHLGLSVQVEEGLPRIAADPPKLKQILYNLLSNAIKFTPEGGQVEAGAKREGDTAVRLWVRDSGIGIKPEDQERIFEAFEQVDSSYARQQQGTGLGLALTKKLVELHQGRIWVESEGEGKGSTFSVVLPTTTPKEVTTKETLGGESGPLVLVVEDDPYARELLTTHLTDAGYRVASAVDGAQGLEQARRLQPAAITLDVMLPGKDGWQVLAELKEDPQTREIPVVIITITEDKQRGLALGAVDFLTKPLNVEVFIQTLERITLGRSLSSVLIIDDALPTLTVLSEVLKGQGMKVLTAMGGQEGISLALEHQPDCIVLDLVMPQMDGFEVVQQLRARPETRQVPILVYTGMELSPEERRQLSTQVQATLSKADLDPEGIVRAIRELVNVPTGIEGGVV